jgi:hypothetical protein
MWEGWKRFALWVAEKQAIVIYAVLYFVVLGPVALVRRPFTDPFQYRKRERQTFWVPRAEVPDSLEEARRQ